MASQVSTILIAFASDKVRAANASTLLSLCSRVNAAVLTSPTNPNGKIAGLNSGADDYVIKPFSPGELLARMRAVWRRAQPQVPPSTLSCRNLTLDMQSHRVYIGHETLELGPTEFRLLKFFLQHPEFFKDASHLNNNGAIIYSKNISTIIKTQQ